MSKARISAAQKTRLVSSDRRRRPVERPFAGRLLAQDHGAGAKGLSAAIKNGAQSCLWIRLSSCFVIQ